MVLIKHRQTHSIFPSLLVFLGAVLVFALMGCQTAKNPDKPNVVVNPPRALWGQPEDMDAKRYLVACENGFNAVVGSLDKLQRPTNLNDLQIIDLLNEMDTLVDGQLGLASLYQQVHPNKAIRLAAEECEQHFVSLNSEMSLSRAIYERVSRISLAPLDAEDKRYVERLLRDFRRSGVDKDHATRDKIKRLNEEINAIGQTFDKNYRNGGKTITLNSLQELDGLPADYLAHHQPNGEGKIIITTDTPDYLPIMQYAKNDSLRQRAYTTYRNMAYPENKVVLEQLMAKRYELAQTVGYANYAAYITEDKMIRSPEKAQAFIDKVSAAATPKAQQEYDRLLKRLQKIDPKATKVADWQKIYLEQLIKKEEYQVDAQKVREYFPFVKVQQGIFNLTHSLFGVTIKPWTTANAWHSSVQAFEMWDHDKLIGRFYLDLHPREGKYKHAAQFTLQNGLKDKQIPIAALVCNFLGGDNPNELMEHDDVQTFLHEFGHLLHNMFSGNLKRMAFSGVKTEWDFVEAPSQMLEEWVWDAATLASFAQNEKGEVIPPELVNKMRAGRDFGRALWIKHQLFYAALSLNVYNNNPAAIDLDKLMESIQSSYSPFGYVNDTHFYTSFGHLNGYSAIYYTYMWSLVIARDMFSEFEQAGLLNTTVAARYRNSVLAPGGSKDAAELVQDFLGRPFSFDAFAKKLDVNH